MSACCSLTRRASLLERWQRRLARRRMLADCDPVEAAEGVRPHHRHEIHRAFLTVELHSLRERRGAHLAITDQLTAEADHGRVGVVEPRERAPGAHDVDDLL